jgi:putative Mn2+ efflux pump MntP
MSTVTLLIIALGVSADAFAVAVGKGLSMPRLHLRTAASIAIAFGLAQALMPLFGWLLGTQLEQFITPVDHWVAFGLLALVGGRMLREALRSEDLPGEGTGASKVVMLVSPRELLVLAVATSIDALAVGISLALVEVNIVAAVIAIGAVTCALSFAGVALGQRAGARFRGPAEIAGGLVLIGIGVKILLDGLGVL